MAEGEHAQLLLDKAREGDPAAMSALLAMHFPRLRARLETRMSADLKACIEPEDIVQQAYLAAIRGLDRFEDRGPSSFLNWLLTILDSKLADAGRELGRRRRRGVRQRPPQAPNATESCVNLLDRLYAHSATPSRDIRREEAVGALLTCISRLPDTYRQVIELRFLKGRSVRDVAEELGKSETAVTNLTMRALAELRRLMDGLGEFTRG